MLSTLDPADFSRFYTSATRLANQDLVSTYGNLISRNTQVPTYISTLGVNSQKNSKFISQFITKYTKLVSGGGQIVNYAHSFKNLSGAQSSVQIKMLKVPTREIYVYTGTQPLFLSDY